jgi:hypothetical protein
LAEPFYKQEAGGYYILIITGRYYVPEKTDYGPE